MHRFDPNENPFVEDLLRLLGPRRRGFPYRRHPSDPVKGRFSPAQFRALARIFLSRLYGVDQGGYVKNAHVWHDGPVRCSVRVVLDDEDEFLLQTLGSIRREQMSGLVPDDTRLVLVHVGSDGVTELFSGRRDVLVRSLIELFGDKDPYREFDREPHRRPLGAWMNDVMDSIVDPEGRVPPLDGVEARDAYWGDISYDEDDAWPRHRYEPPRAVANDGRGRHGGSGDGGDGGDGEGPRGPDDRDGPGAGRGGVMEVLGHPVLFSADPQLLADILENL
ncbi:hypothetical protein [Stenotrophomonas maltophilia]|uniref:hypothetical protein n=1 Tax=Stenotrophomonas maltophilia TaxID=40324 RepID=UPI002894308D|nr:hypothetical protein [Stenotrophomonas maltophilia]MDT3486968.1 hypothetical protein [Stenotrophomonas maltophilia]